MNLGLSEGPEIFEESKIKTRSGVREKEIKWKIYPKQVVLNLNKYIAKYNFEIARKLSGIFYKETKEDFRQ